MHRGDKSTHYQRMDLARAFFISGFMSVWIIIAFTRNRREIFIAAFIAAANETF